MDENILSAISTVGFRCGVGCLLLGIFLGRLDRFSKQVVVRILELGLGFYYFIRPDNAA